MSKLLKYAYGGQVNDMSGGAGAGPYAALATTALSAIPGGKATNDLKYTKMGASLAAINPIAGAVGTGVGLGADLIMGGKAKRDQKDLENQMAKNQFESLYGANGTLNPYATSTGYEQTASYAYGGKAPVGHVIPVEKAREAVDDASKLGVDLSQNVIPGKGHPKADDRTIAPGGQPINVSSGEVYVDNNLFSSMAKAVGMGVAEYQQRMYPNGHGQGYADGGQIPPVFDPNDPRILARADSIRAAHDARWGGGQQPYEAGSEIMPAIEEWASDPRTSKQIQESGDRRLFQAYGTLKFNQDRLAKYMAGRNAPGAGTPSALAPVSSAAQPTTGTPWQMAPSGPNRPAATGNALSGARPAATAERMPTADEVAIASTTASALDAPRGPTMDFMAANNADRSGPSRAEQITPVLGPDLKPIPGSHTKNLNSGALASDPVVGTATAPGGEEAAAKSRGTDLDRLNNITGAVNTGLSLTSLAWNALSRRTPGIRPPALSLSRLNLDTDGLAAELDSDRKAGRATALYNSTNKQGMDRELGVLSADLKARTRNAMVVEGVENQERTANNQIENQERIYNNQQTQGYLQREVEANNNFKLMKGQAVSQSLAATSASLGGWMNNKVQIGAMDEMDKFASRYLKYQFGADETMRWDSDFLYFGDGRRASRNNSAKSAAPINTI